MNPLQGTKFSPHNTVLYESLGTLIKDYRQWRKLSQERLAELIRVGVRELRNWEAGHRRAGTENLHDIAEVTGIPMQVCVALNANQPIWYSLRKRMFMYSSMEEAQFSSPEFFRQHEIPGDDTLLKKVIITKDKHLDLILSCHRDLYGSQELLRQDVIKAATSIIPDYNNIFFDSWGHYVGHQVCLPLKMEVYQALKREKTIENYLTGAMVSDIIDLGRGVFFYYSTFAANISISSRLTLDGLQTLSQIKQKERYLLASHTVTKESAITQEILGMKLVTGYRQLHEEVCPVIYEVTLDFHLRPNEPVRWMTKQNTGESLAKNLRRRTKQIWSPASLETAHAPSRQQHSAGRETDPDTFATAIFPPDRRSGNHKKSSGELSGLKVTQEVCPNLECPLYNQAGQVNIIANGTYRSKGGDTSRRFICKECGKSFCSRTSNIFYGLRTPEEKIMEALALLINGSSLRRVAEIIGVQFRTVRSWLRVAAAQQEKINVRLIEELKITQSELDALWDFVKNNSLHRRPLPASPHSALPLGDRSEI